MIQKRFTYILIALFTSLASLAGSPAEDFAQAIGGKCSVLIYDLKKKKTIDSANPELSLVPASVTKCVTIASTSLKADLNFRYRTKVYMTGSVKDGMLDGNLLVVGGGDPVLGANVAPKGTDVKAEIVSALRKFKVKDVRGMIYTDASIFPGPATPPSWGSGDLSRSYGAGCFGLNYRRNASGKAAVKNPQALFVKELTASLNQAGISVTGDTIEDKRRREILDHVSPPLTEIMRSCMMRSDNLYAETILRTMLLVQGKTPSTAAAAAEEMQLWRKKGAPMQGVNLVDGSGLSRQDRLTANFLGYVLRIMAPDEDYVSYFPLAGQEGTVKNLFKGTALDSYVALKTGTMSGVRCLAGYKLDAEFAPTHVIVIITNNAKGGAGAVNRAAQNMLLRLFAEETVKNFINL